MQLRNRLIFVSLIEELGISERELSRRANLSHSTVNHLMTGRRVSCSLTTAVAITRALGCPVATLFAADTRVEQAAIDRLAAKKNQQ
ncbi:MAG: helix-turn-helix domain-containing protein [Jatrophihabitans sp.]